MIIEPRIPAGEELIGGRDLFLRYGSGGRAVVAVDHVDIDVAAGESVGLVGESGSGKSSLGRLLAGLESPDQGAVTWQGSAPRHRRFNHARIAKSDRWKVQMVFQDPYGSLDPQQTAMAAVAEAVRTWRPERSRDKANDEALALLERMGISRAQAQRRPRGLSGGQRQRVSIARALAPNPLALIADEPTSSIDQSAQIGVLALLDELRTEAGMGIVIVSHDLRVVRNFTTRVYVMRSGRVVESGPTEQVFTEPAEEYTRLLIKAVPGGLIASNAPAVAAVTRAG